MNKLAESMVKGSVVTVILELLEENAGSVLERAAMNDKLAGGFVEGAYSECMGWDA